MIRNTLVSITCGTRKRVFMVAARIINGRAVVSASQMDDMLDRMGVRRGQTFTVG